MSGPIRILLVEDSETDARLVIRELERGLGGIDLHRVEDPPGMASALERPWDVVVSDWSLPRFSALEALGMLKQTGVDVPFIIVSGTIGEEPAVAAIRAGAKDYLLKDRLSRLPVAIEREVRERGERQRSRRTEEALRVSEARFARLAESGVVGIAVLELEGQLVEANQAYLSMLGYSADQFARARREDITPPEWRDLEAAAIARLRSDGVVRTREVERVRGDGSRVALLEGLALLEPPQYIVFASDLSERKRAERALQASEEQFRQAQKMEAIGRLAGGVAHDFNNLLSVVLTYSEIAVQNLVPGDPLRDDIEEIRKAGERAAALTRQLLAFSRQQVLDLRVINLNDLIVGVGKTMLRLIGEDIEIEVEPAPGLGHLRADPGQIEQVLMNLVVNSRDAMPTGGRLTIETANLDLLPGQPGPFAALAPGRYVVLTVADTGVGMDAATRSRVFEPFFTTKEPGKGTGLGLATVFGIVQQSGGQIAVDSAPGRGTTFRLYFPRTDDAPTTTSAVAIDLTELSGSETVLLVEDEPQVRSLMHNLLRKFGYRVLEASNPGEAVLIAERHPTVIDLLITDVVMPLMSGPELASRLTKIRPSLKVLCVSGYTGEAVLHHGAIGSGFAFLQKPITPERLATKIREVLSAAAEEAPRPSSPSSVPR